MWHAKEPWPIQCSILKQTFKNETAERHGDVSICLNVLNNDFKKEQNIFVFLDIENTFRKC